MLTLIKEYFFVGGMPAAVSSFCQSLSFNESSQIQEILLSTYQADFSKYSSQAEQKYLKTLFQGIFSIIAEHFKYSKIDPHIRSRELKTALDYLQWAGLIYFVYSSSAAGIPLSSQMKYNRFKVLSLDTGLVQHALRVDPEIFLKNDIFQINRGSIAEQFVGQELLAYYSPHRDESIFFWEREKKTSDAEVDYLYPIDRYILPIEVKAGPYGRLKSLQEFIKEKKAPLGIQISQKPLSFKNKILSIPFYLISEIPSFVKNLI